MAAWLVSVLFCALAGSTVADPRFTFPELLSASPGRIVSGWEAELGQFPHQLSLRIVSPAGAVSACGGTILNAEWGLTAAHCTAARVTIVIRAGTVNLTQPTYIFETTKYYNHPLYDEAVPSVVQPHDIGLLEFGRSIVFNDNVKPIRIQRSSAKNVNYSGQTLIASGWGRTWTLGSSPENLNWVFQRGISNEECSSAYGGSSTIVDSTICTRYFNVTSQSTCQGDSGGPLTVIDDDGELTQIGVTSFVAAGGCHIGMPAGFIRPGHYHEWFTQVSGHNFDWEYVDTTTTDLPTETTTNVPTEEVTTETTTNLPTEEVTTETTTNLPTEEVTTETTTNLPTEEVTTETTTNLPTEEDSPETTTNLPTESPESSESSDSSDSSASSESTSEED